LKVTINSVNVEWVNKGKTKYGKATVQYSYNGDIRTQNVMSFSNPTVFKQVQELEGKEVEVDVGKNESGFNEWRAIKVDAESFGSSPAPAAPVRVTGSNYETPAERAKKQVYIIKQSSIANAIEIAKTDGIGLSVKGVLDIAQQLTDWVLGVDKEENE
jgi:hypothetical protein